MGVPIVDRTFTGGELSPDRLSGSEFERCTFRSCSWMAADLRGARFTDCVFEHCDLSNAQIRGTGFRNVRFNGCKLLGVPFDHCHTFLLALDLHECRLDYAVLRGLKLKGIRIIRCSLLETDLSSADLGQADLSGSDLTGAHFDGADLRGADLREARNFRIDPERTRVQGARFSLYGLPGLLARHGIRVEG